MADPINPVEEEEKVEEPTYSAVDRMRERSARRKERRERIVSTADRLSEVKEAEAEAAEERRNVFADIGVGAVRGTAKGFGEALEFAGYVDNWIASKTGAIDLNPFDDTGKGIYISPSELKELEAESNKPDSIFETSGSGWKEIAALVPETETAVGGFVEPMAQFIAVFALTRGGGQANTAMQVAKQGLARGAVADFLAFDEHEARLSDMIQSVPWLANDVNAFLASDEDDSVIVGRLKNAVEGAGLGVLFEGLLYGLRSIRSARSERKASEAMDEVENETVEITPLRDEAKEATEAEADRVAAEVTGEAVEEAPEGVARTVDDGLQSQRDGQSEIVTRMADELELRRQEGRATKTVEKNLGVQQRKLEKMDAELEKRKVEAEETRQAAGTVAEEAVEEVPRSVQLRESTRKAVDIPEDIRAQFLKAIQDGDEKAASRIMNDFNANRIDWDALESGQDIKGVLLETERMFADMIDEVKGGVQSNKRTQLLANLVGQSRKEVDKLFQDVRGDKGIAARFYAAQRVMLASAKNVVEKARAAKAEPGNPKLQSEALHAVQTHAAIQAEVKGAQTEIARALQAMSMIKNDMAEGFEEFHNIVRDLKGGGNSKAAWNKYLDTMLESQDLADLNARVRWSKYERFKNVILEYTLNAMLSSPKTHVINFVSNVLNTTIYSFDRTLGGAWRYMSAGDKAAWREVQLEWSGKMHGLGEAWSLAKQAFKDGAPVTDKRQRLEFQTRQAIGVDSTDANFFRSVANRRRAAKGDEVVENTGKFYEKAINTLGVTVRIPGRLLVTGDEFFKAITRNAEIKVLAFRQADAEATKRGLEYGTDAYEAFITKRVTKLSNTEIRDPENIRIMTDAIEKSRLTTFQEAPRTNFGAKSEALMNANWVVKLMIAPFFRTPMNILRQGIMDRTPLAIASQSYRDAIKRGGREAAEARARMLSGMGAMTVFYGLMGDDDSKGLQIVGKLPWDSSAKTSGVKDYSIRIGNNWYQFSRLEPMGMWLGMIADMKTLMHYRQDEDASLSMVQFALFSFLNNVTDKTYMRSIADIQDTMEGIASGREATAERALDRFAAGQFGKLIPQLYKSGARALEDDETSHAKEVWDVIDIMLDRASTFDKDLVPKHDILGRPVPRDAGLSALLNPFAISKHSDDPVDQEFFRLGFSVKPMRKTLGAEGIELTNEEFSKLTGLVGELGLHKTLTQIVASSGYQNMNDELKRVTLKKLINQYRAAARATILTDPQVIKRVKQAKLDAALKLTDDDS